MRKIFSCLVLMVVFTFYSGSVTEADELSELKAQIEKIQKENTGLQEQLNEQREARTFIRKDRGLRK